MKNSSKIRSQFCVLDSLQNFYKSLRFSYYLFFVFLFTLQLFSTNLQAQLWGTSSTPLRGCQASRGIVTLNTLVHTGESIHWAVYKTNSAGGNDGTWTVRVYSPTGVLKATCTIAITTIDTYPTADATPNRCVDSLTATLPADTGLWTIQLIPNASSPNSDDAVGFDVKVKSSPTTILPGRTYTKYLPGLDKNTHSFSLYYLTPDGYLYRANYSGFNGAGFEIVADNLGVQTGVSSCFSNYGSMDLTAASPPNPMPDPVSSTCGGRVKIFFENPFTSITQTTAPVYNFTTSTVVQEPLFPVLVNPTLSNLLFTRTATCNASGSISFTATNYTGEAYLKFDINEDGDYIDAIDRIDTFMVVNGVNTFPFDGLDGFGNSINLSQNLNIELAFAKKGEVHFVFKDVERLTGGIEVSRLNGPGAPDYTLYWDDTKISSGPNCSNTSVLNGTAGINSTGGVHGWGGCSSGENPTMGSSTPFTGSWGNNRIIDNWTYLPISLPDATIIMPGVPGPTSSTTNITICDDELPYTWNGTSYTMAGTFVKTLVNSIGCDSTATLVLTTTVCNFCESASIPNSTSTININGGIETEWLKSTYKPIQKTTIGTISGDFVGTQWKALYDATNLYILVDVKDPNIFNDNSGGNWWEDDVVEIFIDGGNEKATSYDANDFQFAVGADGVIHAGTNGASKIGAITSSVVATPGVGYIVEIAIPWSTIGGTATDGRMIGIDVQIDDDDNGGNRDTQVSWNTNANNAFSNPSVFGQLPLSICTPPPLTLIYDNTNPTCIGLANGSIKAVASGGTIPYSYNLTGPGGPYTSLTGYFSGLNPGNYIVSVTDATLTTVSSSTITIQPFSNPLIVTNDTSVCLGSSVQLNATGGTNGYAWTPIIGLDNPSIANPIATPTVTTTYTVSSQNISNIVVNPDFEAGNVGFNSEYAFYTAQTTARQTYSISENPNNHDINFSTCPDHTTGTGKMLVVDGSDASNGANYKFWQQSIPVNIGLTYTFSYWIQTVATPSPAQVVTKINGTSLGTFTPLNSATCGQWQKATYTWVATSSTADIALFDNNTAGIGNDFAIDDISFSTPCIITDTVRIVVDTIARSTTIASVCSNNLPYIWNSTNYNASGIFHDTLINPITGCDSIATLNLTVKATSTSITNESICPADLPYSWNSNTYTTGGTYNVTLVNSVGCDSVATLNLNVKATSTSITNESICPSDLPYSWNGNTYTTGGTYNVNLLNSVGCDSVATLNLFIKSTSTSITNESICPADLPYSWNGNTYTTGGTYNVTLVNSVGCDSVATLNLSVKATSTSVTNESVCPSDLPYSWNGNTYTTGGTYNVTLLNSVGCDSVATLNLTVKATSTSITNESICPTDLPYSWNGNTYTTGGTYNVTLLNSVGCDSIATLNLNVKATSTSITNESICPADLPYSWNGNTYSIGGTYNVTLLNSVGCDSVATLNLNVKATSTSITNESICPTDLPYSWNGNTYTTGGTYNVTLLNSVGCDSIATLNLNVKATSTSITNESICPADLPYSWNGNTYSIGGTYNVTLLNSVGCDSVATLNLNVKATSSSVTNESICPSDLPYSWNGNTYTTGGTYNVTLLNSVGCDSIATLNLNVKATSTSITNESICPSDLPYSWNGNTYSIGGTYNVTLLNSVGCDSMATLNLTVKATSTSITNESICPSDLPYSWNGNTYTIGGTYNVTLLNSVGCDSVATLNLTVKATSSSVTNESICPTDLPYSWNGNTYTIGGTYNVTLLNSVGCDSIATLNLNVKATSSSITNESICPADLPYSWNGNTYTFGGTYNVTLLNSVGCDSIATLNLTVKTTSSSTTNESICPSDLPYSWNGNTYTTGGTYNVTLLNSVGCDSIATLNLNVKSTSTSITNESICPADLPYSWNGNTYTTGGTYNVTLLNSVGCDSVATLNLSVKATSSSITNESICPSDLPYSWNGNTYTIGGTYNVTLLNSVGCDSIATLNLSVKATSTSITNESVCPTDLPYSWNGNTYTIGGTYNVTLLNSVGCDSVATLNLTVKATSTSITNESICPTDLPYTWNGNTYTTGGTYNVTLLNSVGCDSVATLNLTVKATSTSITNESICPTDLPYSWNGNTYTIGGTYNVTLLNSVGCDSVATLNLTVKATSTSITNESICPSDLPYSWNGNTYSIGGTYNVTLLNSVGCDSIATLNLSVKATSSSVTNESICPADLPYSWNGNTYTTGGTYNVTLLNSVGCDSVATINLTVKATSSSVTNESICPADLPYSWNGNTYTTGGTYNVTLLNSVGCDSVTTLILSVKATSTSITNESICPTDLPYAWNGNTYNTGGTYNVTLLNSVGCDSVATLNLNIKAVSSSVTNESVCPSDLPYSWNGNTYTNGGTYNVTLLNSVGCDSIATLNLNVKATSTSITNESICPSDLPYSWNGNTYTTGGTYNVTLLNSVGCDSVATLNLTVKATSTSVTNESICPTDLPYSWNGNTYTTGGTYNVTLLNSVGCDSVATLNLTVKATSTSVTNESICPTDLPYSWNGNTYTIGGTYNVTLLNSVGCDSVATLNLTVKATSTSVTNESICPTDLPYSWNGNTYTTGGTYNVTLLNSVGCDSIATLNLTVKATSSSVTNESVCPADLPYSWNGNTYTTSGTYNVTLLNSVGCDSVATLNLTVKATSTSITNESICPRDLPYSWNGNTYTTGGTYNVTLLNSVGCDSVATLNLTVKATSTSITNESICPSDLPYTWNGNTYTTGGTYNVTLLNSVGCDSIATLNLSVKATSTSITSESICPSDLPYTWNGNTYTTGGTYNVTLLNSVGCDSVATLNLSVKATSTSITNESICPSDLPYTWNGNTYTTGGTYNVTLLNSVGCDSIATLNLSVKATSTSITSESICPSDLPYTWNGNTYTTSGTYNVTLLNSVGCDSIATLNLNVKAVSNSVTNESICPADLPYSWNGNTYTMGGTYIVTLLNSVGCDSIATLNLSVKATSTSITNESVCPSDLPYSWNGNTYTIGGTYNVTLLNSVGCDSVVTLNLTVKATSSSVTNESICPSDLPYSWNSNTYTSGGTYNVTLLNSVGCDSVATLNLTVKATSTSITNESICPSDLPYSWNGNTYTIGGTYNVTLVNSVGCDSIATLNLNVKATSTSITNESICPTDLPYSWNGNTYTIGGTYNVTLLNSVGCDSIATLNLTVKATSSSVTNESICPSDLPYSWNGNTYTTGGTYNVTLLNSVGCDSVATLNLTVKATSTSITNESICPTDLPYSWNGNTYTTGGTYNVTLLNSVGCDSIATLNLNVKATSTSITNESICPADLPYSWNGNTYSIGGTYNVTLLNSVGCDSVATLNLNVKATSTSITNESICPTDLPYSWNGNTYTTGGTYNVTLLNSVGCDSIATLNLNVKATSTSITNESICPADLPYSWNGNTYSIGGTYNVTLLNSVGCDSVATLNLNVKATSSSVTNESICPSDLPYSWNGNTYTTGGTYNVTLLNSVGCDSIATLNLSVKATSTSITNESVCPTDLPYSWNGNTYTIGGTYNVTLLNSVGCDSVATLNLTVKATSTSITNESICPTDLPYTWNGNTYTTGGTYNVTLLNSVGCDSVATLNLTVKATSTSITNESICPTDLPYSWNGNTYTIGGTYNVTLLNSVGCDSVATLNLTVKATSTSITNESICPSDLPYSWNGNTYSIGGTYNVTLLNSVGCDSIATLNLNVKATSSSITNESVCPSDLPYSWNGNTYTMGGTYNVTLVNSVGCDSVATLNLTVKASSSSVTNESICATQLPYVWNSISYSRGGTYNVTLRNSVGCDSIATLNLTVRATSSSITIVSVCPSELPYSWNGKSYSLGGTYNTTLVNSVGCDSIATLNFSIKSITTSITNVNVCPSQIPYVWNGTSYTNAGVYTVKLINKQGCDSLATINLSVKPLPPAPIATSSTLCQFDKANALSISNPGNYTIIWSNTLSGGISSPSAPIPNTATPGTQTYFVSYANACGESTRVPFVVTVNPAPTVTIAQDELSTVAGVPILINATSPNQNLNILWTPTTGLDNPYTLTPNATLFANQRYIVYVNSLITGCKASDTVLVKVYKDLIVPNIFSPNGDQINDTWMIKYIEQYPTAQVSIFNRYGQFLFTSKDGYKEPWDGTYQGKKVPVGGYFYIIQLTPNSKPISGSLSVVW